MGHKMALRVPDVIYIERNTYCGLGGLGRPLVNAMDAKCQKRLSTIRSGSRLFPAHRFRSKTVELLRSAAILRARWPYPVCIGASALINVFLAEDTGCRLARSDYMILCHTNRVVD